MTWFASHIIAQPRAEVVSHFRRCRGLVRGLHHVTDLKGHRWPREESRHELPTGGLLIGRELCDPAGDEAEWHGGEAISWSGIDGRQDTQILGPEGCAATAAGDTHAPAVFEPEGADQGYPPLEFLRFLKDVSTDTGTTLAFYHAQTWGGEIEVEYAWVFGAAERRYVSKGRHMVIAQTWTEAREIAGGEVLRLTLGHFGLALPTLYCALMTRDFDWERFRVTQSGRKREPGKERK